MRTTSGGRAGRRWGGAAGMGPWWLLYRGGYGPTDRHAHHAAQILSSSVPVVVTAETGQTATGHTLTIPSDLVHQIHSSGRAVIVFADADSAVGRRLTDSCNGHISASDRYVPITTAVAVDVVEELVELVDRGGSDSPPVSAEIAQVLATLADDSDRGTATEFATLVGLSPSRFSQRFTREVGIPLRSYRRWARMLQAIDALAGGASLTDAAHRTGFTDSAHLTHTFRDHFGLAPGELLAAIRFEP